MQTMKMVIVLNSQKLGEKMRRKKKTETMLTKACEIQKTRQARQKNRLLKNCHGSKLSPNVLVLAKNIFMKNNVLADNINGNKFKLYIQNNCGI